MRLNKYNILVKAFEKRKHLECPTCGLEFMPLNDADRYTINRLDGTMADAFDCPQCGCQVIANERYERVEPTERIEFKREKPKYRSYYEKACEGYEDALRKTIGPTKYTFSHVKSFTHALELIHEVMDNYTYISLADWKDIIGESSSYIDNAIGWDNILDMKIEVDGNGYTLIMPPFNWRCDR